MEYENTTTCCSPKNILPPITAGLMHEIGYARATYYIVSHSCDSSDVLHTKDTLFCTNPNICTRPTRRVLSIVFETAPERIPLENARQRRRNLRVTETLLDHNLNPPCITPPVTVSSPGHRRRSIKCCGTRLIARLHVSLSFPGPCPRTRSSSGTHRRQSRAKIPMRVLAKCPRSWHPCGTRWTRITKT